MDINHVAYSWRQSGVGARFFQPCKLFADFKSKLWSAWMHGQLCTGCLGSMSNATRYWGTWISVVKHVSASCNRWSPQAVVHTCHRKLCVPVWSCQSQKGRMLCSTALFWFKTTKVKETCRYDLDKRLLVADPVRYTALHEPALLAWDAWAVEIAVSVFLCVALIALIVQDPAW